MSEGHAPKLVVSLDEGLPESRTALQRVKQLLDRVGVADAQVDQGEGGLIVAWFAGDSKTPLGRLRGLCEAEPELFEGTRLWTPIDDWTEADSQHLADYAARLARKTPDEEPFEIELRRGGRVDMDIEAILPEQQSHPPAAPRILRFEIIGDKAGVSVLEPGDELDVDRARRAKLAHDAFGATPR